MKLKAKSKIKNNKLLLLVFVVALFAFLIFAFNSTFTEKTTSSIWDGTVASSFDSGNGTADSPYIIDDGRELAYFFSVIDQDETGEYFNKFYRLENNINLNGFKFNFTSNAKTFSGTFDGNGYSVFNFVIDKPYLDEDNELNFSLVHSLFSANIKNLNMYDVTINANMPNLEELQNEVKEEKKEDEVKDDENPIEEPQEEEVLEEKKPVEKVNISLFGKRAEQSNLTNLSINNVTVNNNITELEAEISFLIVNDIDNNFIQNINISGNSNNPDTAKLIYHYNNANISNIIYKKDTLYLIRDYELKSDSTFPYVIKGNKLVFVNKYPIKSVVEIFNNNSTLEWKYENYAFRIRNNGTDGGVVMTKSARSANVTPPTAHASGVDGPIVYVNDYQSDLDYFYGSNYTYSSDNRIPDETDKGIYGPNNLVYVNVNYYGTDINGGSVGYVSSTEQQNEFQYYKVYEVNNNGTSNDTSDDYVKFDLIDNPFSARPGNKTFFGWATDYAGAVITLDTDVYVRSIKIPLTYTNGIPNPISIDVHAVWGNGAVINYGSSWTNTWGNLPANGFHPVSSVSPIVNTNMSLYYVRESIGFYTTYPNGAVSETGGNLTGRCYNINCTYYVHPNATYDETLTYYELYNGRMRVFTPQIDGYNYNCDVPVGQSIAGYYRQVTIPNRGSLVGYYNSNGVIQTSGTCNTNGGCNYYELIQYYDENSNQEVVGNNEIYYYFTTRDTNVVIITNTVNNGWTSGQSKPFTLTSTGGYLNLNGNNSNTRNIVLGADLRIENIAVYGMAIQTDDTMAGLTGSSSNSNSTNRASIAGAYYNLKLGRGITQYNTANTSFTYAIGGTDSGTGSASSLTRYTFIVESGVYNNLGLTTRYVRNANYNIYVHAYGTYGSDFDRVKEDNSKLTVVYCASGSWTGNIRSTGITDTALYTLIKSGQFGTNKYDYATGVYVGGRGAGGIYSSRQVIVEGGYIYNLIGGPLSQSSNKAYNDTYMYIKGGNIDIVVGGAGASETYCNRIISMTGGKVNYAIFGGSNGVAGDNNTYTGKLDGDTYVYVGGHATVGDATLIQNNTLEAVSNVESGSVFGIGNGRQGYASIGTVNNATVVIDDGATILKNVYGGGNYGAGGQNGTNQTYNTKIVMLGGAVSGSIYGGGNNNGAGTTNNTSNVSILVNGGSVTGSVYGGSRTLGRLYGSTNVTILGGTIYSNVYGGGEGGYTDATDYGTFVDGNVSVTIGDANNSPTINGNVYGGSAYGTVNAVSTATAANNKTVDVTVNNGTILGKVFGGAKGSDTFTPYVKGDITVRVNGGTINEVYGGFDASGEPEGDDVVYLNGGTITNAFGGGNNTSIDETHIYLQGSTVGTLYGGSNQSGTVPITNVTITSGEVATVYGGNNEGGNCTTTNVSVSGGKVTSAIYGGGNLVGTTTTNVTVTNVQNTVPNIFGGGKSAGAGTTNVSLNDSGSGTISATNVFGGSDTSGNVTTSNVTINKGTITNVYGGNKSGGTTATSHVTINNGNITTAYGGGYSASGTETHVNVNGGTLGTVYGGGEGAAAVITTDTEVIINSGSITTAVYGGGNAGAVNGDTNITINNATGTIPSVFGAGNQAGAANTNILLNSLATGDNNINITNIYGASNQSGAVGTSTITVDKGTVSSIFGGNNAGGTTGTSNIEVNAGTITNVFGGNNAAGVTTTSNIEVNAGTISNVYGGNNEGGTTGTSNIEMNNGTVTTIYGGGNQAEITGSTNININNGAVTNVYGGGNSAGAPTTNITIDTASNNVIAKVYGGSRSSGNITTSNIDVVNGKITNLYGGNDQGGVTSNTNVVFESGTVSGAIYGGGNMATSGSTSVKLSGGNIGTIYGGGNMAPCTGNTSVIINNANITNSAYAGGNGTSATVQGNTSIMVGGTTVVGTPSCTVLSTCSVFGGGNAAVTGVEANNNSTAVVKILGATIYGNVYGGANTSKVFGATDVNIGRDNTATSEVSFGDVSIHGTVFGGGEANASGSDEYDWSFVSVTNAINVNINGANYNNFEILGSVFGSGNASTTTGTSEIMIKNYGTFTNPQRNVSIQRTDKLTIDNSSILLTGATDRENEYSDVLFSLSRIDELNLINNSTLYLETGANLLQEFNSLTSSLTPAQVTIDSDNNTVTKNVDNRVYMYIGQKLNIAKDQSVTDYGEVNGMSFFGMYKYDGGGNVDRGIYDDFDYGDQLDWGDVFDNVSSYVLGLHKTDHDIEVDGFYTNYIDEGTGTNIVNYIEPTPPSGPLYMWIIGQSVIEYEIDLVASKYSTLGTYELPLIDFTDPNTSFTILGVDDSEVAAGISLVHKTSIPKIASTDEAADSVMGLSMESSNTGWLSNGYTEFLTGVTNPVSGTEIYVGGNSGSTPTLQFSLRHSKNIATEGDMGNVKIQLLAVRQINALDKETKRLVIVVNMTRVLYDTVNYEAAITAGRKYDLFATSTTNITSKSSISTFFSLFNAGESIYRTGYYRTLVSNYVLPLNTKLTMIDLSQDNPQYYYQIIDQADVTRATTELQNNNEVTYRLSDFEKMGTKDTSVYYDDAEKNGEYYNSTLEYANEEFIFIIDFSDTTINSNQLGNTILLEIRDHDDEIIYSVLAYQHSYMVYNVYANSDAVIDVDGTISTNKIYNGESLIVDLLTTYTQTKIGSTTIYDTHYFDSKLGIKISLINSDGDVVTGTTLLGLSYTIDEIPYYPSIDGTTRIKIADKVDSAEKWIILDTGTSTIASGIYTLRIESFGSSDGIYYGLESSDYVDFTIEVVNEIYGLEAETTYEEMIINPQGINENGTNTLTYNFTYNSGLQNPNIRFKLYRRKYDTIYSTEYELVSASDYFTNSYQMTANANEYILISDPNTVTTYTFNWKNSLTTGTYRLDFILYDDNSVIGTIEKYVIIK